MTWVWHANCMTSLRGHRTPHVNVPLVPANKIILPPLYIKLGLFKQFVKVLDKDSKVFNFLRTCFPHLSITKIKKGVFVGLEIRKLMHHKEFDKMLNTDELEAWKCFKQICLKFLGSEKAENFEDVAANFLHSHDVLGCKTSIKVHFVESHLNFFYEHLGDVSDEHGERFHQDVAIIEKRFKGKCSVGMLADCCWSISLDL